MESTGRGSDVSYLMVTFDQIYSELGNVYNPSANLYQQQIDAIPTQTAAAVSQADAKKDLAYEQITNSARQRGMGFSGIPIAEQAKYNATEYAPAIANLKSNAEANRVSLLEAMNSLNRDRRTQAQSIYDNNMSRDLAERQFQESIRQFNEQLAAQRAANASTDLSKYLNQLNNSQSKDNGTDSQVKQLAMAGVGSMLQERDFTPSMWNEIVAISKSAGYGNKVDQAKLELLQQLRPGYFKNGAVNTTYISNLLNRANTSNNGGGGGGW